MKRMAILLMIYLLPLSLWAMSPLSDSDLSNVDIQGGLIIGPETAKNLKGEWVDPRETDKILKSANEATADSEDPASATGPQPNKMTQSIPYAEGTVGKANESRPNVVNTPMRTYSTGRADFNIKPSSWVDLKVR